MHPLNLVLRFLLELALIFIGGYWAFETWAGSFLQWPTTIVIPLVIICIWGLFNVPGDPSRSGKAPIPISGINRLLIEIALFGLGFYFFYDLNLKSLALCFFFSFIMHNSLASDRIIWLLKQKNNPLHK